MDFRAVLIPLCVLFTHAPCRPAGSRGAEESMNQTIDMALNATRIAMDHLNDSLPPDVNCSFLVMEPVGLKQQSLSGPHLSVVHCYMQKLSNLDPRLSNLLMTAVQFIKNVEQLLSNSTTPQSCSFPEFKDMPNEYVLTRCFLERVLEEIPSKSNL